MAAGDPQPGDQVEGLYEGQWFLGVVKGSGTLDTGGKAWLIQCDVDAPGRLTVACTDKIRVPADFNHCHQGFLPGEAAPWAFGSQRNGAWVVVWDSDPALCVLSLQVSSQPVTPTAGAI